MSNTTATPSYWAVIPAGIRYDDRIPANAKLLYAEISSLTAAAGYCFAPDSYFAGLYQITERTVRSLLKALEEQGYIHIERTAGEHNATIERRIYAGINPLAMVPSSLEENFQTKGSVRKKFSDSSENIFQTHLIKYQEIISISAHTEKILKSLPSEVGVAILDAAGKDSALLSAWADFAEMRKQKRTPIKTAHTVELLAKKLSYLSGGDPETAALILEQSNANSWTGLFALKDGQAKQSAQPHADGGGSIPWI